MSEQHHQSPDAANDVVVTGMGVVTSIGNDLATFWANCLAGVSGAARITAFDPAGHHSQIACEVRDFNPDLRLSKKQSRRMARFSQLAAYAADEAVQQSGLRLDAMDPARVGCCVGAAAGGFDVLQDQFETFIANGPQFGNPLAVPKTIANMASCAVAIHLGITGPNMAVLSACATGAHNIATAKLLIQSGYADVVVAGGVESTITPLVVDAYGCMGVLSRRNDDPLHASRPFDRDRDGFVIGEGAGVLVLERRSHAVARGAEILGRLAGFGMSCDAHSIAIPEPEGRQAAAAMHAAMRDARINPDQVDYINAHGTSTRANDQVETVAIQAAFGAHAKQLSISSTKSMIGHTLGAAGAIEAVTALLAVRHAVVPPTINLEHPDPECPLNYTPRVAREQPLRYALSNSFGFGGQNCALILAAR